MSNDSSQVPVEDLRGLQKDIFSNGINDKVMIVHAPPEKVRKALKSVRKRNHWPCDVCLVQLRGHDWTILSATEDVIEEGLVSDAGAEELSRVLGTEVVYMLSEDVSGIIMGRIFQAGQPILKMDSIDGIAFESGLYDRPPQEELDEECPEFDVMGHIGHYLAARGTYLSQVYWRPAPELQVEVPDIQEDGIAHAEYVPYE